jgi:hypothetical protein
VSTGTAGRRQRGWDHPSEGGHLQAGLLHLLQDVHGDLPQHRDLLGTHCKKKREKKKKKRKRVSQELESIDKKVLGKWREAYVSP